MTKELTVVSVICRPPDQRIHLAPKEGVGTHTLTLCLEKWKKQEQCRTDSVLCITCVQKWREQVDL